MHCKSYSYFFSKKFQNICVSLDVIFNESLTNDIVSFEQPGPACGMIGLNWAFSVHIWNNTNRLWLGLLHFTIRPPETQTKGGNKYTQINLRHGKWCIRSIGSHGKWCIRSLCSEYTISHDVILFMFRIHHFPWREFICVRINHFPWREFICVRINHFPWRKFICVRINHFPWREFIYVHILNSLRSRAIRYEPFFLSKPIFSEESWHRDYKTFFILNSAEHEIFSANKYEKSNNRWHFHIY